MPKITPTQRNILQSAASAPHCEINPAKTPKAATAALLRAGLLAEAAEPDAPRRLSITDAGRAYLPTAQTTSATKPPNPVEVSKAETKIELLKRLLSAPGGASIADLQAATGWQAHSVRGAIAGSLKRGLKLPVTSQKASDGRRYSITAESNER